MRKRYIKVFLVFAVLLLVFKMVAIGFELNPKRASDLYENDRALFFDVVNQLMANPNVRKIDLRESLIVEFFEASNMSSLNIQNETITSLKWSGIESVGVLRRGVCLNCKLMLVKSVLKAKMHENSAKVLSIEYFADASEAQLLADSESDYIPLKDLGWFVHMIHH